MGIVEKKLPLLNSEIQAHWNSSIRDTKRLEALLRNPEVAMTGTNANESFHRELNARIRHIPQMSYELNWCHIWYVTERHNAPKYIDQQVRDKKMKPTKLVGVWFNRHVFKRLSMISWWDMNDALTEPRRPRTQSDFEGRGYVTNEPNRRA